MATALATLAVADKDSLNQIVSRNAWVDAGEGSVPVTAQEPSAFSSRREAMLSCLVGTEDLSGMCAAMIAAGARDGVTGEASMMVDGMPLSMSLSVFEEIISLATAE